MRLSPFSVICAVVLAASVTAQVHESAVARDLVDDIDVEARDDFDFDLNARDEIEARDYFDYYPLNRRVINDLIDNEVRDIIRRELIQHLVTRIDDKTCKYCYKTFGQTSDRRRHEESVHKSDKPYKCTVPGCSYSSARKDHLKQHVDHSHRTCLYCGAVVKDQAALELHWQTTCHRPSGSGRKGGKSR